MYLPVFVGQEGFNASLPYDSANDIEVETQRLLRAGIRYRSVKEGVNHRTQQYGTHGKQASSRKFNIIAHYSIRMGMRANAIIRITE